MRAIAIFLLLILPAYGQQADHSSDGSDAYWSPQFRTGDPHVPAERQSAAGAMTEAQHEKEMERLARITGKPPLPSATTQRRDTASIEPQSIPFPIYDVDAACRGLGTGASYCVEQVQQYYDILKSLWPMADEATRSYCVKTYSYRDYSHYIQVATCISSALEAKDEAVKLKNPTIFRY